MTVNMSPDWLLATAQLSDKIFKLHTHIIDSTYIGIELYILVDDEALEILGNNLR